MYANLWSMCFNKSKAAQSHAIQGKYEQRKYANPLKNHGHHCSKARDVQEDSVPGAAH